MYHNTNPQERGVRNPNHPTTTATAAAAPQSGVTYGQSPASGPAPTTAGHHKHDILNKLDPRVDSTHDRQPMPTTTNTNTSKIPEGTYGPHRSRAANALDPRVDSDLDSTRANAAAGTGMGAGGGPAPQGSHVAEGTYGPHHSRVANAADPRVDSDRDRHRGFGATTGGHGSVAGGGMMGGGPAAAPAAGQYQSQGGGAGVSAPHTAGPHKSGLLNKLDPRVDSKTGAYKDTAGTKGAY